MKGLVNYRQHYLFLFCTVLFLTLICLPDAYSATVTWDGDAQDGRWVSLANWDTDNLPTALDDVVIPSSSGIVELDTSANAKSLTVENSSTLKLSNDAILTLSDTSVFESGSTLHASGGTAQTYSINCTNGSIINLDPGVIFLKSSNVFINNCTVNNFGTVSHTSGRLDLNNNAVFNNLANAVYDIQAGASIRDVNPPTSQFRNYGTMSKTVDNLKTIINLPFDNYGTIDIQTGKIGLRDIFTNMSGAIISGTGTMDLTHQAAVFTNNGNVSPGGSPGTLTFTDEYSQTSSGTLNIELDSGGYDQLVVNGAGNVTLGGTLYLDLINGYYPLINDSFTIMTYTSNGGTTFDQIASSNPEIVWDIAYNAGDVTVTVLGFCNDGDEDGYGNPGDQLCPNGGQTDCDDHPVSGPGVYPGAAEIPDDAIDQDCNGFDTKTCIVDADQDGYGTDAGTITLAPDGSCDTVDFESNSSDDCDDDPITGSGVYPGAAEIPDDAIDQDCNGFDTKSCIVDADQDGYGTDAGTTTLAPDGSCDTTEQESDTSDDCNDNDSGINPGMADLNCNGIDENCSGLPDEGYVPTPTYCGVGVCSSSGQLECQGGVGVDTCIRGTPGIEGNAQGNCGDGDDNDCDGAVDGMDGGCYIPTSEYYEFERLWPMLQQPWYFNSPQALATDRGGFIYIADTSNRRIQKFTSGGYFITYWGSSGNGDGQFYAPVGIAVDSIGFVYVIDMIGDHVQKFRSDGEFESKWGTSGSGDGELNSSQDIAVDSSGFVYVADTGNNRIQKFDSNGNFVLMWGWGVSTGELLFEICTGGCRAGISGNENGQFDQPKGIAVGVDPATSIEVIYIVDSGNNRIQKFGTDGFYSMQWGTHGPLNGEFANPEDIAVDSNGFIYVADKDNSRIQQFDSSGNYLRKWGSGLPGNGEGEFMAVMDVAVDDSGFVYTTEISIDRIQKFAPGGEFVQKWASTGIGDGELQNPVGIAVNNSGSVYVSDLSNNRIQKFDAEGRFVYNWGSYCNISSGATCVDQDGEGPLEEGDGQFRGLAGLAVGPYDSVYVVDRDNHRIQMFDGNGGFVRKWGSNCRMYDQYGCNTGAPGAQVQGDGQFSSPRGIAVDSSGSVFVVDYWNYRVQKFTSDGLFEIKWGSRCRVSDGYGECLDPDGSGSLETGDGQFFAPEGVAAGSDFVYVADAGNDRIQKFTSGGDFVTKWGEYGTGDGQFINPIGIAIDDSGFVYVADTGNNRIQKFTSDGVFVTEWGRPERGSGVGDFSGPSYVAAGPGDKIHISDTGNNRIQVFKRVTVSSNNKAIIVAAGGNYPENKLWEATRMNTNYAYNALRHQGFRKDQIYYMSEDNIDLDNNGVLDDIDDDTPTLDELDIAIISLASAGADNVILYIADHGGTGNVRMNKTELLDSATLNNWLTILEGEISGNIIVIIDSCESGSLQSIAGPGRIILTSTSPGEEAYFINQGAVSYSNYFWNGVFNGLFLEESHDNAVAALKDSGGSTALQNPMINDGTGNAATIKIGNGTDYFSTLPQITSVSSVVTGPNSATLTADGVIDSDGIARVWAVVMQTGFSFAATDNTILELPSIDLLPTTTQDQYQDTYEQFHLDGTYQIAIFARDRKGDTTSPVFTTVSVSNPARRKAILVAGAPVVNPLDYELWSAIDSNMKTAYNALVEQGYEDQDIFILSPASITGVVHGIIGNTPAILKETIDLLAGGATYDVVIYMIGDGDGREFYINETETVPADNDPDNDDLDTWLDDLQGSIPGIVTVVYDASYSAAYNSYLANEAVERILIASTTGQAYFLSDGDVSFSKFFWSRILNGWTVRDAYMYARNAMDYSTGRAQRGWIDDDGDGTGNENNDGALAARLTIGMGIVLAGKDPLSGGASANPSELHGALDPPSQLSTVITAHNISTVGELASDEPVWVVIAHPQGPGTVTATQTTLVMNVTPAAYNTFDADVTTGDIFTDIGKYDVTVYAKDDEGNIASVAQTAVYQKGSMADMYEEDDAYTEANYIIGNIGIQHHNFDDGNDVDWVTFFGRAGETYTFKATNMGNSDVVFTLYDEAGAQAVPQIPLDSWDESGSGFDEESSYPFEVPGYYYLKISNDIGTSGADTGYDLEVFRPIGECYFAAVEGEVSDESTGLMIEGVSVFVGPDYALLTSDEFGEYFVDLFHDECVNNMRTVTATHPNYKNFNSFTDCDDIVCDKKVEVIWDLFNPYNFSMTPKCWDVDQDGYGKYGEPECPNSGVDCNDDDPNLNPGVDTDSDGMNDCADPDDDNDGMPDAEDNCRTIKPARILGGNDYNNIGVAYDSAVDGDVIQCHEVIYSGGMTFDRAISVTVEGGYDCAYEAAPEDRTVTLIEGDVTIEINSGEVLLDNMEICDPCD
jgi:streptogramin lyase